MGVFHFKQFDVANEKSAMKVNTDGVLLGAVAEVLPSDRNILDIGTGTGTIALMLAQRLSGMAAPDEPWNIQGIDIDAPSAEEAAANFAVSPWAKHLKACNVSLDEYSDPTAFDLIVSNPPYFDSSLQAPEERRNRARHTGSGKTLSYREIFEYAGSHLAPEGRVCLILPADQEKIVLRYARMNGLALWKLLRIRTVERKQPSRLIFQFRRRNQAAVTGEAEESMLTLLDKEGKKTSQHSSLLAAFLL